MQNQPEELGDKLIKQVIEMTVDREKFNDIKAQYVKKNAKTLIPNRPDKAFMILGCISFLEHKTEDMLKYHEKSLQHDPTNYQLLMNYAVSMINTGRCTKALELINRILELHDENDINALKWAYDYAHSAGFFEQAEVYAKRLDKLNSPIEDTEQLKAILTILEKNECTEKDSSKYISLLYDVLIENDVYPEKKDQWSTPDGEIVFEVFVNSSPSHVADMNERLSELMAKSDIPMNLMLDICCVLTTDMDSQMKALAND